MIVECFNSSAKYAMHILAEIGLINVMIINHKCANSYQTAQIIIHTIYYEYNIHRSLDNFSIDTPACHSRDNKDIS